MASQISAPLLIAEQVSNGSTLRILRMGNGALLGLARGRKVSFSGIPAHLSPLLVETAQQMFKLGQLKISWDGWKISVLGRLSGGGCCQSSEKKEPQPDERTPFLRSVPAGNGQVTLEIDVQGMLDHLGVDDPILRSLFAKRQGGPPVTVDLKAALARGNPASAYSAARKTANDLFAKGNYQEALANYLVAFEQLPRLQMFGGEIYKNEVSSIRARMTGCRLMLAGSAEDQKKLDDAAHHYTEALTMMKEDRGAEDGEVGTCNLSLGQVLLQKGDLPEAIRYLSEAAAIRKKVCQNEPLKILISLELLAKAYLSHKDFDQAIQNFQELLALAQSTYGEVHASVRITARMLSTTFLAKGDVDNAILYASKALELMKKLNGAQHPDQIEDIEQLVGAYIAASQPDLGLPYAEKAFEIAENSKSIKEQVVALEMKGDVNYAQGDFEKALVSYLEASKRAKTCPEIGPENLFPLTHSIGLVYLSKQQPSDAIAYFKQALPYLLQLDPSDENSSLHLLEGQNEKEMLQAYLAAVCKIVSKLCGEKHSCVQFSSKALARLCTMSRLAVIS